MIGAEPRPIVAPAGRLRVALIAPSLRYIGGQAVQADLLLRYWKDDPEIDAFFLPVDPAVAPCLRWSLKVPFVRTLFREPVYLRSLYQELRAADIVHAFSASYSSFLLAPAPALVIGRQLGKKILVNYHSGEARDHLQRSRLAVHLLASANSLIVPSGYLKRLFADFGLAAEVVPNLIDFHQFRYRIRVPLRPNLICSRGFHPYYCVDLVVRAFRLVKDAFPDAKLCLLGDGPQETQIRGLVQQLGLTDVEFAGAVSRQDIGRHYERSDIFINASYLDNMPVSILEAFGSGTAVVSTAPEGIRYIVNHERTGLLCEPGDWQQLAANVIRLLREPDSARQLASNAFQESKRYLWDAIRPQWVTVYRSLRTDAHVRSS